MSHGAEEGLTDAALLKGPGGPDGPGGPGGPAMVNAAHREVMVLKWFFKRLCGSTGEPSPTGEPFLGV